MRAVHHSLRPIKRVLVLGGTREALTLARKLRAHDVYSLAGLGKTPTDLACNVRVGGFGGSEGMADFIRRESIDLLLDLTHPYAAQISANAAAAAQKTGIPFWLLHRPAWSPQRGDDWREFSHWPELMSLLTDFKRPFFTLGREPLAHLDEIPASQYWTIRCLDAEPGNQRAIVIGARGPFHLDAERQIFAENNFDVLISKNSGGSATEPKLQVARELRIPVLMLKRPPLPTATRAFDSIAALTEALNEIGL
ncbi:MAG: cobalt-precorrin-6A reductase [Spongiibacteraceae bacterium]